VTGGGPGSGWSVRSTPRARRWAGRGDTARAWAGPALAWYAANGTSVRGLVTRDVTVVDGPTWRSYGRPRSLKRFAVVIFGGEDCPQTLAAGGVDGREEVWNYLGPTFLWRHRVAWRPGSTRRPGAHSSALPGWGDWRRRCADAAGRWTTSRSGELVIGASAWRYLDRTQNAEK